MSEIFHNLSMQALIRDDDRTNIKFDAIEELHKSIRKLLKDEVDRNISFIDFIQNNLKKLRI